MTISRPDDGPGRLPSLEAYVSPLLRRLLLTRPADPRGPASERSTGAVLIADMSGFTVLTERLARHGTRGAEELRDVLNQFFGRLNELIDDHGGEVIHYAGDAALAFWPAGGPSGLKTAVLRAAHCALEAQARLDGLAVSDGVRLRMHVGIGAGAVCTASIGGTEGRWEPFVTGEPLCQALSALGRAGPGHVVLSAEAWSEVEGRCETRPLPRGLRLVEAVSRPPPPRATRSRPAPPVAEEILRAHIPRVVRALLDAGHGEWLAEFRRVSVLFVRVPSPPTSDDAALERLQQVVGGVQTAVYHYGGYLNQILAENGIIVVAAWGLVLRAHEDDATRAVRAAMAVQGELLKLGLESSIGVATGTAFSGIRGDHRRREFALIGDVVNVAARLMQTARRGILCDAATRSAARDHVAFEPLPARHVKGKADPIDVSRPIRARKPSPPEQPKLVGRARERQVLKQALEALAVGEGGVVVVEGDAGIGKSRLVQDLLELARASNIRSLAGSGDALEPSSAYHAWTGIFDLLFPTDDSGDSAPRREHVLTLLATDAALVARAPVLNPVLRLDLPPNPTTEGMTAGGRAAATRELLAHLFERAIGESPALLVLEDAHWLDSASWALAEALARSVRSVLTLVVTRPLPAEQMTPECRRLLERDDTTHVALDALSSDESHALACQRLQVGSLPEPVLRLIQRKAEGHPFFIEQLAFALKERGLIRITDGVCRLPDDTGTFDSLDAPEKIQDVITSRIDCLTIQQQLTLKVASVLGPSFDVTTLHEIHPTEVGQVELLNRLEAIVRLDLLRRDGNETAEPFKFKHVITHEVAYALLPYAQRRPLHRAVAESYELRRGTANAPTAPLLAHHWTRAGVRDKALFYLDLAAEEALQEDATREAVRFLTEALELGGTAPDPRGEMALITRHRKLGEAFWTLGDRIRCHEQINLTLSLLGRPVSHSTAGRVGLLVRQALVQGAHLALPQALVSERLARRERLLEASRAADLLTRVRSDPLDSLGLLGAGLLSLNLAEKAGTTSVFALGLLGYAAATLKLRRLARTYFARGRMKAFELNELRELVYLFLFDAMDQFGAGHHARSLRLLSEGLELARRIGYRLGAARISTLMGNFRCFSGQFERGLGDIADSLAVEVYQGERVLGRGWTLVSLVANQSMALPPAEALASYADVEGRIGRSIEPGNDQLTAGFAALRSFVYARAGELDPAWDAASQAMRYVRRNVRSVHSPGWVFFQGPFEAFVACARDRPVEALQAAREVAHAVNRFSRFNPVYRPRALLFRGRVLSLSGRAGRARRAWRRGLDAATRLSLPLDEALIRLELARALAYGTPERRAHLEQARHGFAQCPYFLAQVESLLADEISSATRTA